MTMKPLDRRTAFSSLAATPALGLASSAQARADSAHNNKPDGYSVPKPEMEGQALLNKDRAYDVMEEYGLAGLIALDPLNVYYMTNVKTIGSKFITEYHGFATMGPDRNAPVYLVSGSSPAWDIANRDRETAELMPYGFGGWNEAEFNSDGLPVEPSDGRTRNYHFRDDVELTPREQRWKEASDSYKDNIAAGAAWGLARALKAQGITKGRVAVDDMRIAKFLSQVDLPLVECVDGYGIFQLIRMVKTPQELAYQRIGSWNNGEACMATINAMEVGMRHSDVEQIFLYECAKRGNHVASVIAGMPGGDFPDEELVAGKPFLIDCVSHYKGYMGDIARTFYIGEPTKEVELRRRANQLAREAVFDAIKPGVKYSTLRQIGLDTMIKAGIPAHAVFVTPHSVGLQHDDNPFRMPDFGIQQFDHVLQKDMVLTVDLPYLEVGYGSGHNEDLFRVTATGYEALNTERDPFVIL